MGISGKELAKMLGLSEAAVSMALNRKKGVSVATRNKVLQAAKEHGYDFSRCTGELRKERICFIIYKKSGAVVADTPFFAEVSEGIRIACKQEKFDLTIQYLYEDDELPYRLEALQDEGYAGVILLATEMDERSISAFSTLNCPLVVLDSYFEGLHYDCVLINNIQGAYLATEHLIRSRKQQPGYLRSSYSIGNFDERADGFYKAIRANGMSTSKSIVHRLTPSQEGAYADMKQILAENEPLASCYFADNDHIAAGVMQALEEHGLRIPEDVAIVGFDDLPICRQMRTPMTTIHVPKFYLGELTARQLIRSINAPSPAPIKIEVGVSLVKRKSV